MANPPQFEPGITTAGAPKELAQPDVAWGLGAHPSFALDIALQQARWFQVAGISLNNTPTTGSQTSGYTPLTNGTIFLRPNYESHLFFTGHFIFNVAAGSPGPSTSLNISLQMWLNGYHILISPSNGGFGNDWTITIPPVAAGQTTAFTQTFMGMIFNLEFRQAPQGHLLQWMYNIPSIPANWGTIQFWPRLTVVEAISTSQINFVQV